MRSMRAKEASAPRLRSSRPASSATACEDACCAVSRVSRWPASAASNSRCCDSAVACSASRRATSSRLRSISAVRWLRWSGCARCRAASPAGGARGAWPPIPSGAARRPGWRCRARRCGALRSSLRAGGSFRRGCGRGLRRASLPGRAAASSASSFCCVSRSSRLMASGPSARGLPPVTVTLWKHSPEGARKKARGFSSASERAVPASGVDVAFAQLGQDGFERGAEAVEHADAVLQAHDAFAAGLRAGGLGGIEGELGLRVVRMHEEGGAAIDVALQQAHAFVGGVPAFDDDVVELVAQVLVDDAFVLAVRLQGNRRACRRRRGQRHQYWRCGHWCGRACARCRWSSCARG